MEGRSQAAPTQQPNPTTIQPEKLPPVLHINIVKNQHRDVTEWSLPQQLSQAGIHGRVTGSNACTVIAVLSGMSFLDGNLSIPKQTTDLNKTIPEYIQMLKKGNDVYESFNLPPQSPNLDVQQILDKHDSNFSRLTISEDTGFFSTEELGNKLTDIVESSQKCFGVLIVPPDKSMLLCFPENAICLFESHSHGQHGGLIATSTTCNIHNFVMYLQQMVQLSCYSEARIS